MKKISSKSNRKNYSVMYSEIFDLIGLYKDTDFHVLIYDYAGYHYGKPCWIPHSYVDAWRGDEKYWTKIGTYGSAVLDG